MAKLLFDFGDRYAVDGWHAIDDRVMGGVSRSRLRHDPAGHAVFEGEVSLAQNGGFASVRSEEGPLGMRGAVDCVIDVRGDGRHFKLSVFTDDAFDAPSYQAEFTPRANEWHAIRLPLQSFRATFRGREVPGSPPIDPARVRQLGLMIAGRQAGTFVLALRSIQLE